jgi:hypothetical protein
MTYQPDTPALKDRSRTFSSSRTAAAALDLPPELFRLARVRGGDAAFDASNRVKERPFVEWLLIYLHDCQIALPPVDDLQPQEGIFSPCESAQLFKAPEATVRRVFCENAASFQFARILWGDAWAIRIACEAAELLEDYSKDCDAIKKQIDKVSSRHNLPLSLEKIHSPGLDIFRSPFEVLGLSHFGFWAEPEKCFPRGPRYSHEPSEPWAEAIDLESDPMWIKYRMVPCCILPDDEYQKAVSDYCGKGYLLQR